jgi:mannose/fructose/N-acetylgalactosamine-specific phosphotransferase system component IID
MGRKIKEYDVQPENMYNMDEKGFLIGILPKGKRIFSRQQYKKKGLKQHL